MFDQTIEHFVINNIFHPNLHGRTPGMSTTTACIQANGKIMRIIDRKEYAASLLVDQSSAYNLIDHEIVCGKLKKYKVEENTIEWFRGYLGERKVQTKIETQISTKKNLGKAKEYLGKQRKTKETT